jgi:O-antigen ligase
MEKKNWSRLSGVFGDEYILGGYLSRFTLLFFGLFFYLGPKLNKNIMFLIFILAFILVFLSGDRAALGVMVVNSVIIYFFLEIKLKIKIFSIFFILICITFLTLENNKFKQRILGTLKQIEINKYLIIGTDSHHKLQDIAIDIFQDNPIVGVGPKLYRKHCDSYNFYDDLGCENHPHNYFIQGMSEGGILTLIIFIYFYLLMCKILFLKIKLIKKNNNKQNTFIIILLLNLLLNFNPFLPTGNIFNNWLLACLTFPIGFLLFLTSNENIKKFK